MLTGDREWVLQQSIKAHGRNDKVPNVKKLVHCLGCKAALSGHSAYIEFRMQPRFVKPAVLIGAKPKIMVARAIAAHYCKVCGEKVLPHMQHALGQLFAGVWAGIEQAEAQLAEQDVAGDIEEEDETLLYPSEDDEEDGESDIVTP